MRATAGATAVARIGPWLSGEGSDRLDPADFVTTRDGEDRLLSMATTRWSRNSAQATLRCRSAILTASVGVPVVRRIRLEPPNRPKVAAHSTSVAPT